MRITPTGWVHSAHAAQKAEKRGDHKAAAAHTQDARRQQGAGYTTHRLGANDATGRYMTSLFDRINKQ